MKNEDGQVLLKEKTRWNIKKIWKSFVERKNQKKDENKDGKVLLDKVQKESMYMMKMSVNNVELKRT